ncbi:DUF3788 domain-containing protein [Calditrichota bacterium]
MLEPVFIDKSKLPTQNELTNVLGKTSILWEEIQNYIKNNIGDTNPEWKFYMKKVGWQLKTLLKKRNLFFFTPYKDFFRMTFVFGDKAVAAVEQSDLPEDIKETLRSARKYMEGRGLSIEVKNRDDLENVKKMLEIKVNN